MPCPRRHHGYSLFELLLTLGLAGLVLTLGLPSLAATVASNRLRTEVNALFHAIHLARQDSITRRRAITLCPSDDGRQCSAGKDWSGGWIRFANSDRDSPPRRDPGEALLQYHRVGRDSRISANRHSFTLRATALRATNGTLVFCDRSGRAKPRALVVSYTGRPRVAYADARGKPYRCPD
ncbi:MAG: Tfp pilus assembly protein FimT/FimU [Gammaproteobacteria bacterium]|nr:MAG: Tfp pilus assembly protein FimT/FimU [Gammaproteobacteria bacterium]